jgi:hypothetical protein
MDIRGAFYENNQTSRTAKKSLPSKVILLILVALLPLGYTLAANINLGGNNSLEFGQGVVIATSCDDQIQVVPGAKFDNQISKSFGVNSITISDISNSCIGKHLTIDLYGETSTSSSNSYGPIVLTLTESGTVGLHFELVGNLSSIASIGQTFIDTGTAGLGQLGSSTYRGSSSVVLDNVLSDDFAAYAPEKSRRITLQTSNSNAKQAQQLIDRYTQVCITTTTTDINNLYRLFDFGGERIKAGLALADFADLQVSNFLDNTTPNRTKKAPSYVQTAVSGIRINGYIKNQLLLCDAHINSLRSAETDLNKIDRLDENSQMISDLIDVALATHDAFAYVLTVTNPYL